MTNATASVTMASMDQLMDLTYEADLFIEWMGEQCGLTLEEVQEDELAELVERFEEQWQGTWDSLGDWAENYANDTDMLAGLPSHLQSYFDLQSWAEDAELDGSIWTIEVTGTYAKQWAVFSN
jgi:antirestriction protein